MEKSDSFSRQERFEIGKKFREELNAHGVLNTILSLLDSKSSKVEIKKAVLKQQCRKKEFATKFKNACEDLRKCYPARRHEIYDFRDAILA